MNDFFERYVRQSHESGAAKTFVAIDSGDNKTVLGFYSWLRALWLTPTRRRRFVAVSPGTTCPASGSHGGQLLAAAARRCLRIAAEVGGVVLIVDAKNDRAARWYASYDAVALSHKPLTLVMSLATFAAELKAAGQL